jgi:hypothetical protein
MEMDNNKADIDLLEDKALADALFGKAVLAEFDKHQNVPATTFFEDQAASILKKVDAPTKSKVIGIGYWGKMAIAASLLTIVATTYLLLADSKPQTETAVYVKIEEIPLDEIENYVNEQESIAEIDWTSEINEAAQYLDGSEDNSISNKDSNIIE